MPPFPNSHQSTHAGQPAGAFNLAPDEEPIASSTDGEVGPPFDLTFLDHWIDQPTGLWDPNSVLQDAINPGLIGKAIAPPFDAGRDLFDFHSNNWNDEVLGFSTGFVSQSAPNPTPNEMTLPFDAGLSPFGFNPWMNQPIGLPDAEAASQSALPAVDPASVTSGGAPSYLHDTSFDWTNEDAGMLDAWGRFADPVRIPPPPRSTSSTTCHTLHHVVDNNCMATLPLEAFCSPNQIGHRGAVEVSEQQVYASAVSVASSTNCSPPAKDGQPSTPCTRKHKKSLQLKCDFEGCTHQGTFPRKWELARHIATKHSVGSGSFVCRAEGCFDKQLPRAFTRSDKLTSHIKAVHTRDTVFTSCPVDRCDFGRCTLETLGVHIARAHKDWEAGRAVFNASPCKVRKCPLWRCGRHVKSRDLPGHVAKQHAKDDILAAIPELEHEGLVVLSTSDSSQQGHAQSGLDITVQCPVCNTTSDDVDGFIAHFWDCHLFLAGSGGADHFESWKSRLVEVTTKWDQHGRINGLPPWAHLDDFIVGFRDRMDNFQCSSCLLSFDGWGGNSFTQPESLRAARNAISAHHLSLLRPEAEVVAELKPHRMQILRLYPEFVSHPVFADSDEPQDGIALSSQEPSHFDGTGCMGGVENHRQAMAGSNTLF